MNCEQARELLPAYLLGALDVDETREVEAHLRAGHEHDDELVELRATVSRWTASRTSAPSNRSDARIAHR